MMVQTTFALLLTILIGVSTTATARAATVRLSVAASMTDAVTAVMSAYAERNPSIRLQPSFGASGSLAKQIVHGAPADIYISANPTWMAYLKRQGFVQSGTEHVFAANTLVFISARPDPPVSMAELAGLARIAIGTPDIVPAGTYARQAMMNSGVYDPLAGAGTLILAKDVRQALRYADRNEVDGAFVYATDARLASQATTAFAVPASLHDPISYPVALTPAGARNEAARSFHEFVTGAEAGAIMSRYGFEVSP